MAAPCTEDPSDIRGNAFYCPSRDIVAWDRKILLPRLQQRFGDFLVAMVLAHEWGHAIQKRTKLPSDRTIVVETQADCYAGAFTAWALKGNAPHFEITRPDLDRALSGFLLFSDPLGSDASDRQAHGSGFDRVSAFQDGYEQGVPFCAKFDDNRTFTQTGFLSPTDEAAAGQPPARRDAGPGAEGRRRVLEGLVPEAVRAAVEAAGRREAVHRRATGRSATGSRCSTRSTAPPTTRSTTTPTR